MQATKNSIGGGTPSPIKEEPYGLLSKGKWNSNKMLILVILFSQVLKTKDIDFVD